MRDRKTLATGANADQAIKEAVREALLDHKRAGNPVAVWRDGKVVIVPPGEIDVDGTDTNVSPPEVTPPRRSTSRSR